MDAEKAIKLLEVIDNVIDACPSQFESEENTINDFGNAMIAAVEALEKQTLKKPKHIETDGFGYCPNCGECAETMGYDAIQFNFCDKCGQKLEWE